MTARKPPSKKLNIEPGESPWLAIAREIATNPDGPAALRVVSHMNRMLRPREVAVQKLIEALARDIMESGQPGVQAQLEAAKANWVAVCGGILDDDLLAQFAMDARELIERRKRQPPEMAAILEDFSGRPDYGYELAGDLGGLRGTWHRLWASISMARLMGSPETDTPVSELRREFEQMLGRAISEKEWGQLVAHAHHHCDTVSKPTLE